MSTRTAPHQSARARFPGCTIAARDLRVSRNHLWQVLKGNRRSEPLMKRWRGWLKTHPEFAALQHK